MKEKVVLLAFLFVIFLQNFYFIQLNQLIFFLIISILFFLSKKNNRLYFFIFLIPFRSSLPFNLLTLFLLLYLLFTYRLYFNKTLPIALIIFSIELISSIESNTTIESLRFLSIIFIAYILYDIFLHSNSGLIGNRAGLYFSTGVIISGILYIFSYLRYYDFQMLITGQPRLGDLSTPITLFHPGYKYFLNYNANEIGINSIFSLLFITNFYKKNSFIKTSSVLLCLILGILSFSRTFFLTAFIFFLISFYRYISRNISIVKLLIIITIFSFIVLFLYFYSSGELTSFIFDRFLTIVNDARIEITLGYFRQLNFLSIPFGKGAINYFYFYNQEFTIHNGFIEVFFSYGIFGVSILFLSLLLLHLNNRGDYLIRLGIIFFIVSILFHQFLGSVQLLFIYTILAISSKASKGGIQIS
jgi:hypothetical protein